MADHDFIRRSVITAKEAWKVYWRSTDLFPDAGHDHDFEALRAERNRSTQEFMQRLADKYGLPVESLCANQDPNACYCACSTGGQCEHRWDGEGIELDNGWSATCSRCGDTAMSHSLRVGP